MGLKVKAVCDSGPLIHLLEIGAIKALSVFSIVVPPEVKNEVKKLPANVSVEHDFDNDFAFFLQNQFDLGLAESQCIALSKTHKIQLFLTDDLDARTASKQLGLEPHGTIGILLKAYKNTVFTKTQAIELVKKIKTNSTLYITSDLIEFVVEEIKTH